jgi:Cd2+/Zn2+-exporting ATPase
VGDKVNSSTLVVSGSLKILAEKVGKDTTFEKIIDLIERSRKEKPRSATMGERFGKIYLIAMLIGSILIYVMTKNTSLVLAIVLVVCADDVAVAIPLAYLRAISSATKRGIIIKGGRHLEVLANVKAIVFDKTGTLTKNILRVTDIIPEEYHTDEEVINIAAMIANRSDHPISKSISEYAVNHNIKTDYPDSAESFAGKGIVAHKGDKKIMMGRLKFLKDNNISFSTQFISKIDAKERSGSSMTFIAVNNKPLGAIAIEDTVKDDARGTIEKLYSMKIRDIVMLTGDNAEVAKKIALQTGVKHYHSQLMPEDKVNIIKDLHHKGGVAMVGDGINDAAALSVSSVGIAMGAIGTDGAIESAEIVLMKDRLSSIPEVIALAKKTKKIAKQDFYIWGITNIFGLFLVLSGFIGPSGAAAYNFISDFLPLINSARAKIDKKSKV